MHPEDLINGCPRGACGLSNDILDLGPDRLDPVLGGSKNGQKFFRDFWTPLKPDQAVWTQVQYIIGKPIGHPLIRSSGCPSYLLTISYLPVHEMSSPYCPPSASARILKTITDHDSWSIIRHPNSSLMWTVQKIYTLYVRKFSIPASFFRIVLPCEVTFR